MDAAMMSAKLDPHHNHPSREEDDCGGRVSKKTGRVLRRLSPQEMMAAAYACVSQALVVA
ncbi:unnamed protein product [Brassica rapa]|uniref:Uncharacterized protein n=1 Tax=Brassica campestris TaxID=3711 RepID=A0A3P6BMG4_BRACM|nr:unnamed protein product [Brassica rapa]VDC97451.1 unnamed protein product [Brassica rapa]